MATGDEMEFGRQPPEDFNKKQIAEITGLTERQVQFYTEQGVVTPEIDPGEGRGSTRYYSDHNVAQFMIIKGLSDLGMTISKIRPAIKDMKLDTVLKRYASDQGCPIFLKISRMADGKLTPSWSIIDSVATRSVLDADQMKDIDVCIVINFSRIAKASDKK
jgi:DNA-binding transcriptional MerR regulator